jgi:hypothetical protein
MVDACIELVEGAAAVIRQESIVCEWLEGGSTEWGIHEVEQLQEQDADPEALRSELVRLRLRDFDDQALGTQLGQVIAQLTRTIRSGGEAQGLGRTLVQVTRAKTPAATEMDEASQRLHDRQQAWVVQFQARCPTGTVKLTGGAARRMV